MLALCRLNGSSRRSSNAQRHQCREEAYKSGDDERLRIGAEPISHDPCAIGCGRSSELVGDDNPSENHAGFLLAERFGGELGGRRNGCDPVEAIENGEYDEHSWRRGERIRKKQQRQSAQPIIPEQQLAAIEMVG